MLSGSRRAWEPPMPVIRRPGRSQIVLGAVISTLLAGCNPPTTPCEPTDKIRVELGGKVFAIPTELQPSFLRDGAEVPNLPSRKFRDAAGHWAYCQRADEPAAKVSRISFPPAPLTARAREIGRPQLRSLYGFDVYVGEERRPISPLPAAERELDGFPVTYHEDGAFVLFGPTEDARKRIVYATCGRPTPTTSSCWVHSTSDLDLQVRLLLNTAPHPADAGSINPSTPHPISTWPSLLEDIDAFLGALRMKRAAQN